LSERLCLQATLVMTDHPGLSESGHLSEVALRTASGRLGAGVQMSEETCRRTSVACTHPARLAWCVDIGTSSSALGRR
jgi:hypothetical protein